MVSQIPNPEFSPLHCLMFKKNLVFFVETKSIHDDLEINTIITLYELLYENSKYWIGNSWNHVLSGSPVFMPWFFKSEKSKEKYWKVCSKIQNCPLCEVVLMTSMVNKFLCFIFCILFQIIMDQEPRLAFKITAGQPISEAPLVPVQGNLLRGIDSKTVKR